MRPNLALASIDAVAAPHRHGHRCDDGNWYNPGAGTRTSCAVLGHLGTAAEQVHRLHTQVHDAAHHDPTVRLVMQGMTGFTDDDLDNMATEDAEGWMRATRLAIEELAHQLDRDPVLEARAAAVRARLEAAGLETGG